MHETATTNFIVVFGFGSSRKPSSQPTKVNDAKIVGSSAVASGQYISMDLRSSGYVPGMRLKEHGHALHVHPHQQRLLDSTVGTVGSRSDKEGCSDMRCPVEAMFAHWCTVHFMLYGCPSPAIYNSEDDCGSARGERLTAS